MVTAPVPVPVTAIFIVVICCYCYYYRWSFGHFSFPILAVIADDVPLDGRHPLSTAHNPLSIVRCPLFIAVVILVAISFDFDQYNSLAFYLFI